MKQYRTKNQIAYHKQQIRLRKIVSKIEKQGFQVAEWITDLLYRLPNRVTQKRIQELQDITPGVVRRFSKPKEMDPVETVPLDDMIIAVFYDKYIHPSSIKHEKYAYGIDILDKWWNGILQNYQNNKAQLVHILNNILSSAFVAFDPMCFYDEQLAFDWINTMMNYFPDRDKLSNDDLIDLFSSSQKYTYDSAMNNVIIDTGKYKPKYNGGV